MATTKVRSSTATRIATTTTPTSSTIQREEDVSSAVLALAASAPGPECLPPARRHPCPLKVWPGCLGGVDHSLACHAPGALLDGGQRSHLRFLRHSRPFRRRWAPPTTRRSTRRSSPPTGMCWRRPPSMTITRATTGSSTASIRSARRPTRPGCGPASVTSPTPAACAISTSRTWSTPCVTSIRGRWCRTPRRPRRCPRYATRGWPSACARTGAGSSIAFLDQAGLLGLVDAGVTSARAGSRKPHPDIYDVSVAALGVETAEVVFVGDSWEPDVRGPRRVGMTAVHVWRRGGATRAAPAGAPARRSPRGRPDRRGRDHRRPGWHRAAVGEEIQKARPDCELCVAGPAGGERIGSPVGPEGVPDREAVAQSATTAGPLRRALSYTVAVSASTIASATSGQSRR